MNIATNFDVNTEDRIALIKDQMIAAFDSAIAEVQAVPAPAVFSNELFTLTLHPQARMPGDLVADAAKPKGANTDKATLKDGIEVKGKKDFIINTTDDPQTFKILVTPQKGISTTMLKALKERDSGSDAERKIATVDTGDCPLIVVKLAPGERLNTNNAIVYKLL